MIHTKDAENRIIQIRDHYVMLDRDLAELYKVETKVLNQAVKRNISRFPEHFLFRLTKQEKNELVTICDRFKPLKYSSGQPYAFTEHGVAMLSAVLRSQTAVNVSIQIINSFIAMRKLINNHTGLFQRIEKIEIKQLNIDKKFDQLFTSLGHNNLIPAQGIFFENQVFDAYELASKIIRSADQNIILIDNYIDENTLTHLSKKKKGVHVHILTKSKSKEIFLDIDKANTQYENFKMIPFEKSHDRFIIIDKKEVYHLGASLKDLGKKWFAFSKIKIQIAEMFLQEVFHSCKV